jgi:hypothetical protein
MSAATRAVGIGADPSHFPMDTTAVSEAPSASGRAGSTVLTRTLYVNVTGSLANLAMQGPSAGSWKLVDGKCIGVFGLGAEVDAQVGPVFFLGCGRPAVNPFSSCCRSRPTSCGRR